jgi:hypothetical protein
VYIHLSSKDLDFGGGDALLARRITLLVSLVSDNRDDMRRCGEPIFLAHQRESVWIGDEMVFTKLRFYVVVEVVL